MALEQSPLPPGCLSWPIIIIAIFLFFPVGVVLLVLRVYHDRTALMGLAGPIMKWVGLGVMFFGLFSWIGAAQSRQGIVGLAVAVFFGIGGVILFSKGRDIARYAQQTRRYINLVVNQQHTSIPTIAQLLNRQDIQRVTEELDKAVSDGFLPGYRVERDQMKIVPTDQPRGYFALEEQGKEVAFKCLTCGANNLIALRSNQAARCNYCGSPASVR